MSDGPGDLRLATVSVVYGLGADDERAAACEALLARDEVVTVRIGRGEEASVFRADVAGATPGDCGAAAARIACEVGTRLGAEARHVDVQVSRRSDEEAAGPVPAL